MTHPNQVHPDWHQKTAIFWEVQNRHGIPGFHGDTHDWSFLAGDLKQEVQKRTKTERAIYVRVYGFGKYPSIYRAMAEAGAQTITLQEAEDLIASGKPVAGVPGAEG